MNRDIDIKNNMSNKIDKCINMHDMQVISKYTQIYRKTAHI